MKASTIKILQFIFNEDSLSSLRGVTDALLWMTVYTVHEDTSIFNTYTQLLIFTQTLLVKAEQSYYV